MRIHFTCETSQMGDGATHLCITLCIECIHFLRLGVEATKELQQKRKRSSGSTATCSVKMR